MLGPLTTLEVGGPARYFVEAQTEDDIAAAFNFAAEQNLAIFVLGGGSNVVISDNGFDGLVVHIRLKGIDFINDRVTAAAGEDWDALVEVCVRRGLAGIECLSGIPGTVGGTPIQNVGAYGQEVSETITSVRCFDRQQRRVTELSNRECGFSYRSSIFNTTERERYVVLSVSFLLKINGQPKIEYKDLIEYFKGRETSLVNVRNAVLAIRRSKSMVIDESDENRRSAGSFFKNPVVSAGRFAELTAELGKIPHYPTPDDQIKVPAAWLVEHSGFDKGFTKGNVGVSTNHTLAIVNRGGATAAEIIGLKNDIQSAVLKRFEIEIAVEPNFVGSF